MFNNKKFKGFTLAEVLVAMTIVGVVAALTVPAVTSDAQAKSNKLKAQKAYATLVTAAHAGMAMEDYTFGEVSSITGNAPSALALLEKTLKMKPITRSATFNGQVPNGQCAKNASAEIEYKTDTQYCETAGDAYKNAYKLPDGSQLIIPVKQKNMGTKGCSEINPCLAFIDINGEKEPNSTVMCSSDEPTAIAWAKSATGDDKPYDTAPVACTVAKNAITDIYPILIMDEKIEPATSAAMAILEE